MRNKNIFGPKNGETIFGMKKELGLDWIWMKLGDGMEISWIRSNKIKINEKVTKMKWKGQNGQKGSLMIIPCKKYAKKIISWVFMQKLTFGSKFDFLGQRLTF